MTELHLRLLGVPEVTLDTLPVVLKRKASVALLAYLAITGRAHHREVLTALFGGDASDDRARKRLSNALAELRTGLGDAIVVQHELIWLDRQRRYWLDVEAFEAHAGAAGAAGAAGDVGAAAAGALYRDELLAGLALDDAPEFEEWLLLQRERLRETLVRALQGALDAHARRGAADAGIAVARRLLALEPWREEAHCALMALLARAGQRSASLAQYGACRRALAHELGVTPSRETEAVYARLLVEPAAVPTNLPAPVMPLVGRDGELDLLADLLADPTRRLITVTGLGGSGKTRLAVEAAGRLTTPGAARAGTRFPDGVYFVALGHGPLAAAPGAAGPAGDPADRCVAAVEGVLGRSRSEPARPATALAGLPGERRVLLVLDGLDDAATRRLAAATLPELLGRAPGVVVLATAREPFHLEGETVVDVPGLPAGAGPAGPQAPPAAELFLQEAGRVRPGWRPDAATCAVAAEIGRLVGGLPLALLQAARCLRGMECAAVAAALRRGTGALDLLSAAPAGDRPAGQTVRSILEDAWHRLDLEEGAVLRRLAIFRDSFTVAAAAAVAGAGPAQLLRLVDGALVCASEDGRYALVPLVRLLAAERLAAAPDEADRTRARHAGYFGATSGAQDVTDAGPARPTRARMDVPVFDVLVFEVIQRRTPVRQPAPARSARLTSTVRAPPAAPATPAPGWE